MTRRFPEAFKKIPSVHQAGLSLVELLIAMLLGVILTMGVVQIFFGSSKTYRLNDSVARNQEGGRFALDFMQRELRGAGEIGCSRDDIQRWLDQASPAYLPYLLSGDNGVVGWEFVGTALGNIYPITTLVPGGAGWSNGLLQAVPGALAGRVIPGTDILVINRADRITPTLNAATPVSGITLNTNPVIPNIPQWSIVLAVRGNCGGADMFQKTNGTAANGIVKSSPGGAPGNIVIPAFAGYSNAHDAGSTLYVYSSTAYYVGRGVNGEPGLFRLRLDPVGGVPEEIVDGVENMQVLYGIRTSVNPEVDRYVTATGVANWENVVSVRMSLLLRSETEVADERGGTDFNLAGTRIQPMADRRVRLVSTTTVGLRSQIN